jgi:probable HAF family extracellular repeat protein
MRRSIANLNLSTALAVLLMAASHAAAGSYNVVDLGALPGGSTTGRAINLAGDIVGSSGAPQSGISRAFFWSSRQGVRSLGVLAGGDYSDAFAINHPGQVTGSSNTTNGVHAFFWSPVSGFRDVGTLAGDASSRGFGINDSGQVVGYSSGAAGVRAFVWSSRTGMQSLGTLGGNDSEAYAVNNAGQIVGISSASNGKRAFLWTSGTGMQDLGVLAGDTASRALSINARGMIVGSSFGPAGGHAVLWNNGTIQNLGTLGGNFSVARGVNNAGQVVGESAISLGPRAFLWTSAQGMQDLNSFIPASLGIVLTAALSINDNGQIVAIGATVADPAHAVDLDDPHHPGPTHAFLLTPAGATLGQR